MATQVWFREDIRNALNALWLATELGACPGNDANADYARGYRDALRIVATSFGLGLSADGALDAPRFSAPRASALPIPAAAARQWSAIEMEARSVLLIPAIGEECLR